MPSSHISEWVLERERSPYRSRLFCNNGILIIHKQPNKPDDIIRVPMYNVFTKNRLFFENIVQEMDFDPKYHYQPKKMSNDLYHDIGLWQILLILNKCRSEIDFVGKRVKFLDPDQVMEYMSRMFVDEDIDITIYDQ